MANTIKEDSEFTIKEESTWGTVVAGSSLIIPVTAGEWMHENVGEERDEMVRNKLARDFGSFPTVRSAEGSIGGLVIANEPWFFLDAILGGTEIKGNLFEDDDSTDTTLDVHDFFIGRDVRPMTIQQRDNIMTGASAEIFTGMLCSSFTLRGATGEGALEWEAEMIGKGRLFAATPKTAVDSAFSSLPQIPLVGSFLSVAIDGSTTPKLLDFEIVFSREIELAYGADSTMIPNIRRQSVPRITFRASIELQDASDIQKYAADVQGSANAQSGTPILTDDNFTGFESNIDTWHFRIATVRGIGTAMTPTPGTDIAAGKVKGLLGDQFGTSPNKDQCLIDIFLDRVSYGEAPVLIDRSETTATFEFRGVALYDAGADARVGVFRVINSKTTTYATAD